MGTIIRSAIIISPAQPTPKNYANGFNSLDKSGVII